MILPNAAQLRALFPKAPAEHIAGILEIQPRVYQAFGVNTPNRLAFFLATIGHESTGLTRFEEGLNYRAERLHAVWPKRFPTVASAVPYAHNPEKLANKVYGGRLGNVYPGDGWKFRGRGYIQITGRTNYSRLGRMAGVDLIARPDLASDPTSALAVAAAFCQDGWKHADSNDFIDFCKFVNGGTIGFDDRLGWLVRVRKTLAQGS